MTYGYLLYFQTTVHRSTNWAIEGICFTCLKCHLSEYLFTLSVLLHQHLSVHQFLVCLIIFQLKSFLYYFFRIEMSGWPSGLRRCVQVAVLFWGRGFESHFWQNSFLGRLLGQNRRLLPQTWLVGMCYSISHPNVRQQSGAVEACWAHNPEVGRSKLPSASNFLMPGAGQKVIIAFWSTSMKVSYVSH